MLSLRPGLVAMKKMRDVPESDRPREKLAKKGVSSLSDSELVEVILGRGTKDNDVRKISKEIVDLIGRCAARSPVR